jgi:hypothetical protein
MADATRVTRLRVLGALASALTGNGDHREALLRLEEAERLASYQRGDEFETALDRVQIARLEIFHLLSDPQGIALAKRLLPRLAQRGPSCELMETLLMYVALLRCAGDTAASECRLQESLEVGRRLPGEGGFALAALHRELARTAEARGDLAAMESHLRAGVEQAGRNQGGANAHAVILLTMLGAFLVSRARLSEAEAVLADARARHEAMAGAPRSRCASQLYTCTMRAERQRGHPERALVRCEQMLRFRAPAIEPHLESENLAAHAEAAIDVGRNEVAAFALEDAESLVFGDEPQQRDARVQLALVRIALQIEQGCLD